MPVRGRQDHLPELMSICPAFPVAEADYSEYGQVEAKADCKESVATLVRYAPACGVRAEAVESEEWGVRVDLL
jgi:hypothetical protein